MAGSTIARRRIGAIVSQPPQASSRPALHSPSALGDSASGEAQTLSPAAAAHRPAPIALFFLGALAASGCAVGIDTNGSCPAGYTEIEEECAPVCSDTKACPGDGFCISGICYACETIDCGPSGATDTTVSPDPSAENVDSETETPNQEGDCGKLKLLCDVNAECIDDDTPSHCVCKAGYEGDGKVCANIDECADPEQNHCSEHALCTDLPGSYTCDCGQGFRGDGVECADINECREKIDDCPRKKKCVNTLGAYECR